MILKETRSVKLKFSRMKALELADRPLVLGVPMDFLQYEDVLTEIASWRRDRKHKYVVVTNPHSLMMCQRDALLLEATRQADLVVPDGVGAVLAGTILGYRHCGRISGPTLMLSVCEGGLSQGVRHFFYGGRPGIPESLARGLEMRFPGLCVAGVLSPPFHELSAEEDNRLAASINSARPDIVWVGLGSPKQEKWMLKHVGSLQAAALIGVGAAFDFHAGVIPWAPRWIRLAGLEWAWRLILEPRRMWRRNLDSPLFLLAVLKQKLHA
jgi:N-acetylglucosaminyldiphosphoundecaprenol N-acetyl-beta-D-mannosaminyltransferase